MVLGESLDWMILEVFPNLVTCVVVCDCVTAGAEEGQPFFTWQ